MGWLAVAHTLWVNVHLFLLFYLFFGGSMQFPSGYFSLKSRTMSGSFKHTPSSWLPRVILWEQNVAIHRISISLKRLNIFQDLYLYTHVFGSHSPSQKLQKWPGEKKNPPNLSIFWEQIKLQQTLQIKDKRKLPLTKTTWKITNKKEVCSMYQLGWTLCGRPNSSTLRVPGDSRSMIP